MNSKSLKERVKVPNPPERNRQDTWPGLMHCEEVGRSPTGLQSIMSPADSQSQPLSPDYFNRAGVTVDPAKALQPRESARWLKKIPRKPTLTRKSYYPSFPSPEETSPMKHRDTFPGETCSTSAGLWGGAFSPTPMSLWH